MERLFVLAESFTMIRRHDEQRLCLQAETIERLIQLTDERIGVCDLAVVRPVAIARRIGLGRFVRIVRLVQVNPQPDTIARALTFEPCKRRAQRVGAGLLQRVQLACALGFRKLVVVPIESASEASAPLQHDGRHERRGPKARAFQNFGEQRRRGELRRRQVVSYAQLPRQPA